MDSDADGRIPYSKRDKIQSNTVPVNITAEVLTDVMPADSCSHSKPYGLAVLGVPAWISARADVKCFDCRYAYGYPAQPLELKLQDAEGLSAAQTRQLSKLLRLEAEQHACKEEASVCFCPVAMAHAKLASAQHACQACWTAQQPTRVWIGGSALFVPSLTEHHWLQ